MLIDYINEILAIKKPLSKQLLMASPRRCLGLDVHVELEGLRILLVQVLQCLQLELDLIVSDVWMIALNVKSLRRFEFKSILIPGGHMQMHVTVCMRLLRNAALIKLPLQLDVLHHHLLAQWALSEGEEDTLGRVSEFGHLWCGHDGRHFPMKF